VIKTAHGTIRREAANAKEELALLQTLKVGDVRRSMLFPALEVGMEWTCTEATPVLWKFDGTFFGQRVLTATIRLTVDELLLDVENL